MKYKNAVISFWYKELEYNPICKVGELENNLGSYFQSPFLINEEPPFINIGLPRIVAHGINQDYLFNMSLVNANLFINLQDINDINDVILKINELSQTVFASLKEVYNIEILYSSIKIEISELVDNKINFQKELLLNEDEYEDFSLKTCHSKNNKYYINETISLAKEVKIDISIPKDVPFNESDMISRSMLISLDGKNFANIKNQILEINDRLNYNNNSNYRVSSDDLRNLLFEFNLLLKER